MEVLSNYYAGKLEFNGIPHNSIDHCYQYQRADRYNNLIAMNKLLCVKSAAEAKQIGSQIRNFQAADWDSMKTSIMEDLIRIKFNPGSELATRLTAGKSLAEAGKSQSFGIGLSLHHSNVFDTSKWSKNGNILGKTLKKLRDELTSNEI